MKIVVRFSENSLRLSVLTSERVKMYDACSRRGIDQSVDNPGCMEFPFAIQFPAVSASRDSSLSSTSSCLRAQSYRAATGRVAIDFLVRFKSPGRG